MGKVNTDVIRRVQVQEEQAFLEVRPSEDNCKFVKIVTTDEKSKDYFGEIDLVLEAATARALGMALVAAAKEAEKAFLR